ncbi:MAG: OsmC family protein [Atribacterota bacterium]|nr:OsmC family protein [Candidatus Atribacteria bacterium]
MAYVELVAQKGKIEADIQGEKILFKSSGVESDAGHWPTEYVLAALGSCFSGTVFAYAKNKNYPLEKVAIKMKGELGSAPSRIQKIDMAVELIGNLTLEEKERIIKTGERACTVMNTLRNGVEDLQARLL